MLGMEQYTVKESDLDGLGHMNFNRYVLIMSEMRLKWLADVGLALDDLLAKQLGTALITFDTTYHKELRLGDTVDIETRVVKVGTKSFTMLQRITLNGELCTDCNSVLVIMDLQARKAIEVPEEIKQHLYV